MKEYTLDTNILIGMEQRYPRDVFPSAWEALESVIDDRRACICTEVLDELHRGTDDLHTWAKTYNGFVCDVVPQEIVLAGAISVAHPEWVRQTQNAADPFLIAHAQVHRRIVVTEERRAGPGVISRNQKVPNVAATVGVTTISFLELARAESWQF